MQLSLVDAGVLQCVLTWHSQISSTYRAFSCLACLLGSITDSSSLLLQVDCIFADVAQPDQARIVGLNAQFFLKNGGAYVISIKASCIDSTAPPEAVFAREVKKLTELELRPKEQVRLATRACASS